MIIVILFTIIISSSTAYAESIYLSLEADSYKMVKGRGGFDLIEMEEFRTQGSPGNPMLPTRLYNVLLPPDVVWDSLKLKVIDVEMEILPGQYDIAPGTPDIAWTEEGWIYNWGPTENIKNGKNIDIYGAAVYFPQDYLKLEPYSQMRKWKFTRIRFTPFQYNPVSKKLNLIRKARVEITFTRSSGNLDETLLRDRSMEHIEPGMFFNYESAKGWYLSAGRDETASLQSYDYVIITTNLIETNSTKLSSFVTHKQNKGHSVLVVTYEDDIQALTGQAPDNRAEKIRQWLINNYSSYGIDYVLLIGDPHPYESGEGDIPMKMCWPLGTGSGDESPTDCFYADLTGNWDLDGDQYYGEWTDYTGPGGVDFAVEVWVGRIPVYSADYTTLDNILQKIMDYENESGASWRESILIPMGFQASGYDGAQLAEQMKDDYLDTAGFTSWRMYQLAYVPAGQWCLRIGFHLHQ